MSFPSIYTQPPQKSGKIAENVFQSQSSSGIASVGFYLQILERYLYFYNQGEPVSATPPCAHPLALTPASAGVPGIEARIINELLERVQGCMSSIEPKSEVKHMIAHARLRHAFFQLFPQPIHRRALQTSRITAASCPLSKRTSRLKMPTQSSCRRF